MNRLISQKDGVGCGFACLANLLAIPYQKTLLLIDDGKNKASYRGLYCKDIVNILRVHGYTEAYFQYLKPKTKKRIYKSGSIFLIIRMSSMPRQDIEKGYLVPRSMGFLLIEHSSLFYCIIIA